VQWTPQAPTKFKLAVTSRREGAPFEIEVDTPEEVRRRFADELRLWQTRERTGD
jgi:hypothetical protein